MVTLKPMTKIKCAADPEALFHLAALDFTKRAIKAVQAKGVFNVVLSGGSTPKDFFATLTRLKFCLEKTPWQKIQFFFADERYLAKEHPDNNYHMAHEQLFAKLSIPDKHIFPMPTHFSDPFEAAKAYEHTLHQHFQLKNQTYPPFDVVYLGLGTDAHTASLFPFSDVVLSPPDRLVASLWSDKLHMHRLTLTAKAINHAAAIIFMVTGLNKASAVQAVLEGPVHPQKFPAQLIHCKKGKTLWYLDQAAASLLSE